MLLGPDATGNLIEGNYIGADPTGKTAIGNSGGIVIDDASGNNIGGTTSAAANVISGNMYGIAMGQASNNVIEGNDIGTDASRSLGRGLPTTASSPT